MCFFFIVWCYIFHSLNSCNEQVSLLLFIVEESWQLSFFKGCVYNSCGPNDVQWERLVDQISIDDDMRQGFCTKTNGKFLLSQKWDNFALIVNELGPAKKPGDKWKDVSTQILISNWTG